MKVLADSLTGEFGRGFSISNLRLMRQFYLTYRDRMAQTPSGVLPELEKGQTVSGEFVTPVTGTAIADGSDPSRNAAGSKPFPLSWSHYVFLLGLAQPAQRAFYEIEAAGEGWSLRELRRQFDSGLYERLALSRDKAKVRALARQGQQVGEPKDILKNPFVLEFLGVDEKAAYSESDLESAIIDKLEHFLLELGKGFLFEARQKRFTFGEEHFFVDLVFYNRLLRSYVVVLERSLGDVTGAVRAKRPKRLPVVLSVTEVAVLLRQLEGVHWLVACLLYGSAGLRLMEALRLWVRDLDFEYRAIVVRDGEGRKDRVVTPADELLAPREHLESGLEQFVQDRERGKAGVCLPHALASKYPAAPFEWGWQCVNRLERF